jgi:nucleoside-diphosphate-sugar epimerase
LSRSKTILITGGSGFVGKMLVAGLQEQGYLVHVFDRWRGPLVDLARSRMFGTSRSWWTQLLARALRRGMCLSERLLIWSGAIQPSGDDILELRSRLVERFRGIDAVIHLAAFPHPNVPGVTEEDFQRINYVGAVNVFEAAREASVEKFIFASSAQVYGINRPVRIDQFPILETNYCPTRAEGQSIYGQLKWEFERYLDRACSAQAGIQALALRLEFPGVRSLYPWNFYISNSIENTVAGFVAALEADFADGFGVFNLSERVVDPKIVDIQKFLRQRWLHVPNFTTGNECLLSSEKASQILGYRPRVGGSYYSKGVMW